MKYTAEDVLYAVVRQALVLGETLTPDDVIDQIKALGRGDVVRVVRAELRKERR